MASFIVKRVLGLVAVLFGMSLIVFGLMAALPGDTALAILGPYATPERVAALNRTLGLDRSLPRQYLSWLERLLHGDFGRSYSLHRPVLEIVLERLGPTLLLGAAALFIGTFGGLVMGALAAVRHGSRRDRALTLAALAGISTPSFWLSMLLMLLFGVWAKVLPVSGMHAFYGAHAQGLADLVQHLVLPSLALGVVALGVIARLMRTQMLEALSQDYIRMARAKGLPEGQVLYRHAFKSALAGVVPVIGLQAGFVLGGAIYVETVFQWPGVGRMLVEAIARRDLLLVQGGVIIVATVYVLVNLVTDVIQRALDPRIELS